MDVTNLVASINDVKRSLRGSKKPEDAKVENNEPSTSNGTKKKAKNTKKIHVSFY